MLVILPIAITAIVCVVVAKKSKNLNKKLI